jgi:hypothetical protein
MRYVKCGSLYVKSVQVETVGLTEVMLNILNQNWKSIYFHAYIYIYIYLSAIVLYIETMFSVVSPHIIVQE